MALLITDRDLQKRLIARRRRWGVDRFDEVWEGTYVMAPAANNEHFDFQGGLTFAFRAALSGIPGAIVNPGGNITDRESNWRRNFRCPDVVVFMPGHSAINRDTHWFGGPDFAVEIVSPNDRSRKKLKFYASVGVRELLIIDRNPYAMEFFRLTDGYLASIARLEASTPVEFKSEILPLDFRWVPGTPRPQIEVLDRNSPQKWLI